MSYTDAEIDLIVEARDLEQKFLDAKEKRDKKPEEYAAAKQAFHDHRVKWRTVRDAFGTAPADGDANASPDGTTVTSTVKGS